MLDTSTKLYPLDNGTYICNTCQFIFGSWFIDKQDNFEQWHIDWHKKVIK